MFKHLRNTQELEHASNQLNSYFEAHKDHSKKVSLMKKLITDQNMQTDVFPTLFKLKNAHVPLAMQHQIYTHFYSIVEKNQHHQKIEFLKQLEMQGMKVNALLMTDNTSNPQILSPVFVFLYYCVHIHEQSLQISPIHQKEYNSRLKRLLKSAPMMAEDIEALLYNDINAALMAYAGISRENALHALTVINKLTSAFQIFSEFTSSSYESAPSRRKRSRKIINFKHEHFITTLSLIMRNLFKQPLYKVIATATNVVFNTEIFNEENVKQRIHKPKRVRIR